MSRNSITEPIFNRSEIAQILNVSTLTISNREKNNKYPNPKRDLNNYRVYSLNDVFNLQLITYNHIDPKPIISIMYDKEYLIYIPARGTYCDEQDKIIKMLLKAYNSRIN
jgi:DNA-binding XRE family transcriptional regulator